MQWVYTSNWENCKGQPETYWEGFRPLYIFSVFRWKKLFKINYQVRFIVAFLFTVFHLIWCNWNWLFRSHVAPERGWVFQSIRKNEEWTNLTFYNSCATSEHKNLYRLWATFLWTTKLRSSGINHNDKFSSLQMTKITQKLRGAHIKSYIAGAYSNIDSNSFVQSEYRSMLYWN